MKSLYLAHPFDSRHSIREWEQQFEERTGIILNNPFYDQLDRTDIERIDAGRDERYEKLIAPDLVKKDLRYILQSDGLLGVIDGSLSYGTIMEIVYANVFNLPVFLIVTNGHHDHPWLKQHADYIFASFEDAEDYLCPAFL